MSVCSLSGKAKAVFTFPYVPTWNVVESWFNAARFSRKARYMIDANKARWRSDGEELAKKFLKKFTPKGRYLIEKRAMLIVKVFKHEGIWDVHNPCIKQIADGFTDAGVWRDDEWAEVPVVIFMWGGLVHKRNEERVEIEVHELERMFVDGVLQPLPSGRVPFEETRVGRFFSDDEPEEVDPIVARKEKIRRFFG